MTRFKLTLVLQEALGWKTYGAQLCSVLETRDDIHAQIIPINHSRRQLLFVKRDNLRHPNRLLSWRDPINALNGTLGAPIREAIKRFDPSAIHFAGHRLAGAVENTGMPFTVTTDSTRACLERDLPHDIWTQTDAAREAQLLRAAAQLFPMSSWTASSLREDYGVDSARISLILPSITLRDRAPRPDLDGRLPRIIFIGNDFVRKGGDRLCNWMKGPLAGKAELHVVSGDPRATGDIPGVVFHGRVANDRLMTELLPRMNLLCHPTLSDMSPLVVAEAAAAGIPAVASLIAGIPDLIIDGQTGFLRDPNDAGGFVSALEHLLSCPELRRDMGDRAYRFARENFDARRNFNAMFDRIIEGAQQQRAKTTEMARGPFASPASPC
jgi:glycosyltransferase involved in cell wall biosynthesis